MSSTSLTPDEIRAAAETHGELGPEYQSAVIESFIDKVGKEIDRRVDARLAQSAPAQPPGRQARWSGGGSPFALAVTSMVMGIPLTGINAGAHGGLGGLAIIWGGLGVINVIYSAAHKPPPQDR